MTYYVMQDEHGNAWAQAVDAGLIVFPGHGVTVHYQGDSEATYKAMCRELGISLEENPAESVYE